MSDNTAIPVFVDSSSLLKETAWGEGALKALADASAKRAIHLYVSELVTSEVATTLLAALPKAPDLKALRRALSWLGDPHRQEAFATLDLLSATIIKAQDQLQSDLESRLTSMGATIVRLDEKHSRDMWRRYFGGHPPFGAPKARLDLPDGAIFSAAIHLQRELGRPLHVVVDDKRLRRAFSEAGSDFVVHQRLGKFTTHAEVTSLQHVLSAPSTARVPKNWKDILKTYLASAPELRTSLDRSLLDTLPGKEVESRLFPSDDRLGYLYMVGEVEELNLGFDLADDPADALVTFSAVLSESTATLFVHRSEAPYDGDPEGQIDLAIVDYEWNESTVKVDATFPLQVEGVLRLTLEWTDNRCRLVSTDIEDISLISVHEVGSPGEVLG